MPRNSKAAQGEESRQSEGIWREGLIPWREEPYFVPPLSAILDPSLPICLSLPFQKLGMEWRPSPGDFSRYRSRKSIIIMLQVMEEAGGSGCPCHWNYLASSLSHGPCWTCL